MLKTVDYVHLLLKEYLNNKLIHNKVLDATCGLGNDTIFMALLKPDIMIDSYDIQEIALNKTKEKLNELKINNVNLINDSFINLNPLIYDIIIFNLGYLPNHNKEITTKADITLKTVNNIINNMDQNPTLKLIITVYPGHEEGKKESILLDDLVNKLDNKKYLVNKIIPINQNNAPYILNIEYKNKNSISK